MTIKNLHQRKITAARLREFKAQLAVLESEGDSDAGSRLAIAHTRSYIEEFEAELADFDALTTATEIPVEGLDHLGEALIRARVASGLTQAQLAERIGLKTAAISRYEATDYRTANLNRLARIANALDFNLTAALRRENAANGESP